MAPLRDLTHGGQNVSLDETSSTSSDNPFGNENTYMSDKHVYEEEEDVGEDYPLTGGLLMDSMESSGVSSPNRSSDIMLNTLRPPSYDRYPSFMLPSEQRSSDTPSRYNSLRGSGASLLPVGVLLKRPESQSGASDVITDPFTDADFSPFGGYPLSSFPLRIDEKELDDYIHNPDPIMDLQYDKNRFVYDLKHMDKKAAGGLVGLVLLVLGACAVFIVLPVLTYSGVADNPQRSHHVVHNNGSGNATHILLTDYVYPQLAATRMQLVDPDTPNSAQTRTLRDGSDWQLVFSDEFNKEGRTFYDGDDQFWYAADLNYAATQDLEWYDPDAVTTSNGALQLRLDAMENHNLFYRSGMLHSWNRMCFTQGILEFSVKLPNLGSILGLWPGLWTLGNIGRPGYMATTDGTWPYSYEACDAGITSNQSSPDGISYLRGQKLNSCTCPGEDHPNPGVGRGAPEIDVIELANDGNIRNGVLSQSLQVAPFDIWYYPNYDFCEIYNYSVTAMNTYTGGPFQQAVSLATTLNNTWYEKGEGLEHNFQKFSFEYLNDNEEGYIRWFVGEDPTLTLHSMALAPNGNVDWRRISKEPMSIIMNLGMSNSWSYIDWPLLEFPFTFEIDYVRVYQPRGNVSVTCDPEDHPTYDYIQDHLNAYENYNLTSWRQAGYRYPRNSLLGC